jgi:hypothetical protein
MVIVILCVHNRSLEIYTHPAATGELMTSGTYADINMKLIVRLLAGVFFLSGS